jgi:excisionase family DNA binding protein
MEKVRKMSINTEQPSRFEQLWSVEEAAEYLGMAPATLYGWRCRRYGPPSYRLGNKIRYRPDEVRSWVEENVLTS